MEIEFGMQPNCSELIIRLSEFDSVKRIKDELEKINIREYLLKNYYDWAPKQPTKWDEEDHVKEIVPVKDLPKNIQKHLEGADDYTDEKKQEKDRNELMKAGVDLANSTVVLLDGEQPLVMPNGTISVYADHDGSGPAIVGHQHCNWDMFPILKKISEHFGEEVHAYDGGSIGEYERFLNGEEPEDE